MSKSTIEWLIRAGTLPETWNPVTGCNKVSAGCKHCYAEVMHRRLMHIMPKKYNKPFLSGAVMHPDVLQLPLHWKKPRTVFVNSMSDLFHEHVTYDFLSQVVNVMLNTPQHTYIILTKRIARARDFFYDVFLQTVPAHIWIGPTVENQQEAILRIPELLNIDAAVRILSCEPLLGLIELSDYLATGKIHQVICGGESGHKARPMRAEWVKHLQYQCRNARVPFFFKQWGEHIPREQLNEEQAGIFSEKQRVAGDFYKVGKKAAGRLLDGYENNNFPLIKTSNN